MRTSLSGHAALGVGPLIAAGLLAAGCGGGTTPAGCSLTKTAAAANAAPTRDAASASWPYSNADLARSCPARSAGC